MSMSRFFIVYWLVLGEPIYNINRFVLQESGGFYSEGVWLVVPSEEASRQKCD